MIIQIWYVLNVRKGVCQMSGRNMTTEVTKKMSTVLSCNAEVGYGDWSFSIESYNPAIFPSRKDTLLHRLGKSHVQCEIKKFAWMVNWIQDIQSAVIHCTELFVLTKAYFIGYNCVNLRFFL